MGLNLIDRIQAKIELFRLEQRYTRRRHRRSTFVSNAIYVDGEYIYQSPNTTGSSSSTAKSTATRGTTTTVRTNGGRRDISPLPSPAARVQFRERDSEMTTAYDLRRQQQEQQERKKLNRWSSMPGFGSTTAVGAGQYGHGGMPTVPEGAEEWRRKRISFHGGR
ncbi:hypothetical protein VTK26DRAFT_3112 [Humicola hyalothermophila]